MFWKKKQNNSESIITMERHKLKKGYCKIKKNKKYIDYISHMVKGTVQEVWRQLFNKLLIILNKCIAAITTEFPKRWNT